MSKLKLLSIAVIGLLLINVAVVGFFILKRPPAPPFGRPPLAGEGPKKVIIERLDFDAAQIAAYEKLITAHQNSIKGFEDSIRLLKNQLYQTLTIDNFYGRDSLINQLGSLEMSIEQTNYEHFTAIKKLCNPDQLDKFNKLTNDLARFFEVGKKKRRRIGVNESK
jgi:periplasmic protein CpxP/Spy